MSSYEVVRRAIELEGPERLPLHFLLNTERSDKEDPWRQERKVQHSLVQSLLWLAWKEIGRDTIHKDTSS